MNVTLTYNKIIVKALPESEITKGGIILPLSAEKQQTMVGVVQAVGPGRITDAGLTIPCCVKAGDKILYSRYVGSPIEIDNEKYAVMADVEAILIFNDTPVK
jgi:chaperonin GroES